MKVCEQTSVRGLFNYVCMGNCWHVAAQAKLRYDGLSVDPKDKQLVDGCD